MYSENGKIVFVMRTGEEVLYSPDGGWDIIRKGNDAMIIPPKMTLREALQTFREGKYNNENALAEWVGIMFE